MSRWLLAAFSVSIALAEPQYMLDHVLPRGGTRGTTVDVTLYGKFLNDPKEILFYDKGIKGISITPGTKPGEEVKAKFAIALDAAIGEHVLRRGEAPAGRGHRVKQASTKIGAQDSTIQREQVRRKAATISRDQGHERDSQQAGQRCDRGRRCGTPRPGGAGRRLSAGWLRLPHRP